MTEQVTGYVEKVNERQGPKGRTYSLLIRPQAGGDGEWYGFYTNRPAVSEGQLVRFAFTRKGQWLNAEPKTVEVIEDAGATKAAAPATSGAKAGRTFTDDRQNSIVMQSSSKTAVDLLNVLISAGAVHLGKTDTKAAASKKYDALMELHEELTLRLFHRATQPEAFLAYVRERMVTGMPAAEDVTDEEPDTASDEAPFTDF